MIVALATFASVAHASPANLFVAKVKLRTIITGLSSPIALAWRGKDAAHIYVALQGGSVIVLTHGKQTATALQLTGLSVGGEEGLLGMVFSGDGKKLYVDYTDTTGDIHIVEYTMKGNIANPATRRELLVIPHHIFTNHNGGNLVIGPDNMLYIGVGDGGGGGDSLLNGQNTDVLLGKILRIDPTPSATLPYTIPPTIRSSARPTSAARSGCTGCAIRGASRSIARPATCGSATSARTSTRRSTTRPRG